jgi:cell division GTPase FtsZ
MPGLINIDFADLRTVIEKKGKALMGTGESKGENHALQAAEAAISNPLLEQKSLQGASGILINITGGKDLTAYDVDEAVNRIQYEVDPQANIIFGATYEESYTDEIRISVIATGIDAIKPPELMVLSSDNPHSSDGPISSYHRGLVKAQIPQESQNREHDQPVDPVKSEVQRSWKYDIFNAPIQHNTIQTYPKPLERQTFVPKRRTTPDQTNPDDQTDLPDFLKVNK